jgi:hypothetical protein
VPPQRREKRIEQRYSCIREKRGERREKEKRRQRREKREREKREERRDSEKRREKRGESRRSYIIMRRVI